MADSELLFDWANDPDTRATSKSTTSISRADHNRWMDLNVAHGYPMHVIMMADTDYGCVGVVRFDADKGDVMRYRVSITIAPEQRGRGFGQAVLDQACRIMHDSVLVAEIKPGNLASRRIFEQCGFEPAGSDHDFVRYCREPML